jgi:hypothetical protein
MRTRSTHLEDRPIDLRSREDLHVIDDPRYADRAEIVEDEAVITDTRSVRRFSPASIVGAVAGLALVVIGVVALTRAGTSGPMDQPVVSVAGFDHTAVLGIVEIVAGGLMALAAAMRSRGALLVVSMLVGAAAIVAAIEPTIGGDSTAIEPAFAVIVAVGAGLVALLAAILPDVTRATRRTEVH